jgi:hypothetical protein
MSHVDVSKCTKGPTTVDTRDQFSNHPGITVRAGDELLFIAFLWNEGGKEVKKRQRHNAALIAEAFDVATETGLSPREMADRLAEIKKAIQRFNDGDFCQDACIGVIEEAACLANGMTTD